MYVLLLPALGSKISIWPTTVLGTWALVQYYSTPLLIKVKIGEERKDGKRSSDEPGWKTELGKEWREKRQWGTDGRTAGWEGRLESKEVWRKGTDLKRRGCHQDSLPGQLPSGIRSDIYLGEFIMVQAYTLDITALRRNLCVGKLGDGHTRLASIPLSAIRRSTLIFGEEWNCPGGQSCVTMCLPYAFL